MSAMIIQTSDMEYELHGRTTGIQTIGLKEDGIASRPVDTGNQAFV